MSPPTTQSTGGEIAFSAPGWKKLPIDISGARHVFDLESRERSCQGHSISMVVAGWQTDDEDLLKLHTSPLVSISVEGAMLAITSTHPERRIPDIVKGTRRAIAEVRVGFS